MTGGETCIELVQMTPTTQGMLAFGAFASIKLACFRLIPGLLTVRVVNFTRQVHPHVFCEHLHGLNSGLTEQSF